MISNNLKIRHTILRSENNEAVAEVWWKPLDITHTDWAFQNSDEKIYEFEDESPLALKRNGPDSFELVPVEIRISRSIETTEWEEPRNVAQLKNLIQGTYTAHVVKGDVTMAFTDKEFVCRLDIGDDGTVFDDAETIEVSEHE